jgi:hypothetical protein
MNELPEYVVRRTAIRPTLDGTWEGLAWRDVLPVTVGHFHPASSGHRPEAQAKLVYDAECLYGLFRVKDRYVVCTHTGYQTPVYRDACVEFFVKPKADEGYMNFEMNCGGGLLLYYIADCRRKINPEDPDDEFESFTKVPAELGSQVKIYHSLPAVVFPEIESTVE